MSIEETSSHNNKLSQSRVMAILRDAAWQSFGFFVAVIGIVVTLLIFNLERPKKELTISIESVTSLVDVNPEASNSIEIRYKGQVIENASIIQIRISNSGNQPITEEDFSRRVSFAFNEQTTIIDYSVTESSPPNIGLELAKMANSKVELLPVLLNQGDAATIRFIAVSQLESSLIDGFRVDGRIVGVREIVVQRTPIISTTPTGIFTTDGTRTRLTPGAIGSVGFQILLAAAILWIVYNIVLAGIKIAGAKEDADKRKDGLKSIINSAIGLMVALSSFAIVQIIQRQILGE